MKTEDQKVHGYWVHERIQAPWSDSDEDLVRCSVCCAGFPVDILRWTAVPYDYCPWCGSKMDKKVKTK